MPRPPRPGRPPQLGSDILVSSAIAPVLCGATVEKLVEIAAITSSADNQTQASLPTPKTVLRAASDKMLPPRRGKPTSRPARPEPAVWWAGEEGEEGLSQELAFLAAAEEEDCGRIVWQDPAVRKRQRPDEHGLPDSDATAAPPRGHLKPLTSLSGHPGQGNRFEQAGCRASAVSSRTPSPAAAAAAGMQLSRRGHGVERVGTCRRSVSPTSLPHGSGRDRLLGLIEILGNKLSAAAKPGTAVAGTVARPSALADGVGGLPDFDLFSSNPLHRPQPAKKRSPKQAAREREWAAELALIHGVAPPSLRDAFAGAEAVLAGADAAHKDFPCLQHPLPRRSEASPAAATVISACADGDHHSAMVDTPPAHRAEDKRISTAVPASTDIDQKDLAAFAQALEEEAAEAADAEAAKAEAAEAEVAGIRRLLCLEACWRGPGEPGDTGSELELRLFDEGAQAERSVLLRDSWSATPVAPGDYLSLVGRLPSPSAEAGWGGREAPLVVEDQGGLLVVLHPDVLVSATRVGDAFACNRRGWLSERVGDAAPSRQALLGTMTHRIFQAALRADDQSPAAIAGLAEREVAGSVADLYAVGVSDAEALAELRLAAERVARWCAAYLRPAPAGPHAARDGGACVSAVRDIEETIASPAYGIKGQASRRKRSPARFRRRRPQLRAAGSAPKPGGTERREITGT